MLTNCTPNLRYAMLQSLFSDFLSLLLAKQESELSESKEPQNTSKKYQLLWRVFCSGFKKCHYKSHIAVLFRTALVHEIYCGVHLARHNRSTLLQRTTVVANKTATIYIYIYILAVLDVVIAALHQTAAIYTSFCGILQWRYIKPPQEMCLTTFYLAIAVVL